jgi:hypothetical protein
VKVLQVITASAITRGNGAAPPVITLDGTESGVPPHAFTDGADWMADQLYNFMLLEVKAQKELGLHLLSNAGKAKQRKEANLLNNINRVTFGKFFSSSLSYEDSPISNFRFFV